MQSFILRECVLNDDTLIVSDKGKVFKGNYIAIVEQYSFLNSWCNKKTVKRFRNKEALIKFLNKHYSDVDYLDFTDTSIN